MRFKLFIVCILVFMMAAVSFAEQERAAPVAAMLGEDGVQRIEMEGGDFYFKPESVILKVGVPVEIFIRKTPGFVPHNIIMESSEAGMSFDMDFGRKGKTIMFTPTKTGNFEFWCDKKFLFFKSHRAKGMEGIFSVIK
jgi:plastocyanin